MAIAKTLSALDLGIGVTHAINNQEWVVVLYPDAKAAQAGREALPGLLPPGTTGGGRTFRLPGGGRISVACASDDLFVPKDTAFTVLFLGWGDSAPQGYAGMAAWRQGSSNRIDLARTRDVIRAT